MSDNETNNGIDDEDDTMYYHLLDDGYYRFFRYDGGYDICRNSRKIIKWKSCVINDNVDVITSYRFRKIKECRLHNNKIKLEYIDKGITVDVVLTFVDHQQALLFNHKLSTLFIEIANNNK